MKCCEKCFVDPVLVKHLRKKGCKGACDYCGARGVKVMPADNLHETFRPLIELFEPLDEGKHSVAETTTLPECIEWRSEWHVFSDSLPDNVRCDLLDKIRRHDPKSGDADGYRSREPWAMLEDSIFRSSEEDIWEQFADSIKWKRRFIPETLGIMTDPKDWLPQFLHEIAFFVKPLTRYYRARLGGIEEDYVVAKPFEAKDMGVPPRIKATAGRANPAGIPYLYVAEKEVTAVSEIRPFLGAKVTIAQVKPKQTLRVIDLTRITPIDSPFEHSDLRLQVEKNALLGILNRELSKPVSPALAEIEYIPTQYLAEVILNANYDGIRYKSAMNEGGFNVAFFDYQKLDILGVTRLVEVVANKVEFTACHVNDKSRILLG